MSDFNEQLPEWNAAGTEPPAQKKAEGWQPREKPPAGWFNWLFNRAFKCIEEIRGVVSGVITSLTGLNNTVSTHLAENATSQNKDIYVYTTGNDETGNGSINTPYRTIQKAINSIGRRIDHTIRIYIADGTYNEIVSVTGFIAGKGSLSINGNTTTVGNVKVTQMFFSKNTQPISCVGIEITTNTTSGIQVISNDRLYFEKIKIVSSGAFLGFDIFDGKVTISNCEISNRSRAISAEEYAHIYSTTNTGTGNTFGLTAFRGAMIAKNGTQSGATTAESTGTGGVIR